MPSTARELLSQAGEQARRYALMALLPKAQVRRHPSAGQVGIRIGSEGISIAGLLPRAGALPRVLACEHRPLPRLQDLALALRPMLLELGLADLPYHYVLGGAEYRFLLVDTPEIPEAELREAVRWRVQDALDFPAAEAVMDICDMPPQLGDGRSRPLGVVACRSSTVAQKAALFDRCGIDLQVIDTPEFALRNLAELLPDPAAVALLHLDREQALLAIVHAGTLYLCRRLTPGSHDAGEALVADVLRTLEYYEGRFPEPPVTTLYLAPTLDAPAGLAAALQAATQLRTVALDLNLFLDAPAPLSPERQAQCVLALGAALRNEQAML